MTKDYSQMALPSLAGFIVIGQHADGHYAGYVENSFSMSVSKDRTQFLWSGQAYGNFGGTFTLDGNASATRTLALLAHEHPEYQWKAYDVHDPAIPFLFNWDEWRWGSGPSDQSLSGVVNKYVARNPRFAIKDTCQSNAA